MDPNPLAWARVLNARRAKESRMSELTGVRVAVLATDGVEEAELTEPVKALRDAGARVEVAAPRGGEIQTFRHFDKFGTFPVDRVLEAVDADDYDALVLPGGTFNAETLRVDPKAREFIRAMVDAGRPVAAIGHAPEELISAGVARGRTMTSHPAIEDDVRNAGARWENRGVVLDGNLITSRERADLPAFLIEMLRVFGQSAAPRPVKRRRRG